MQEMQRFRILSVSEGENTHLKLSGGQAIS